MSNDLLAMKADAKRKLESILKHITYKPGWTVEVGWCENLDWGWAVYQLPLKITMIQPDVTDPARRPKPFVVFKELHVYQINEMKEEHIVELIGRHILSAEEHEWREWFCYHGVCVKQPHPELSGTPR